jgi:GT2 family glycosyltransferase
MSVAVLFLKDNPNVAAVFGRRRERYPARSVYNQLCDWEWDGPPGESRACGGDVMIKTSALREVHGYRETLIAGEEPELCVRLRASGWRIVRLNAEMTVHDAAMIRFSQWWRRAMRGGYAFAEGAYLHGSPPERHWVWESRRAWIWGMGMPLLCLALGLIWFPWGWISFAIYPVQVFRQTVRGSGSCYQRATTALFQVISRFPEVSGQLQFWRDRMAGRKSILIEYK